MDTAVEFGHALYYPYIECNSRRWLRTSALYHDTIGRIVTRNFNPPWDDSEQGRLRREDMRRFQSEGFIQDEYAEQFTESAANSFYELALANSSAERRAKILPVLPNPNEPFTMYRAKLDPTLLQLMRELNLARDIGPLEVEADSIAGALYMRTLAVQMAGLRPLVTDDPVFEAMAYAPGPSNNQTMRDNGFLLASAVFRTVVPLNVEEVPLEDLISFRKDHRDLRLGFQAEIKKMVGELAKLQKQHQITQCLDHYADTIDAAVNKLEAKLRLLKVGSVAGCFSVSLPGWATAGWGLGLSNPFLLLGTLGAVLAITAGKSVIERQLASMDSGVGYVHYLRRYLAPKQYAEEIVRLNLSGPGTRRNRL